MARFNSMDVKDVPKLKPGDSPKLSPANSHTNLQRAGKSLNAKDVALQIDVVELAKQNKPKSLASTRDEVNAVINVINHVVDSTEQIDKLVTSVEGIVEQVDNKDVPESRSALLETEANELVQEIKLQAGRSVGEGIKPLAGDKIELQLEEQLGKTLEVLLPDDARSAFGIGDVRLSTAETIIQTRVNVQEAKARLANLKSAVDNAANEVKRTVAEFEVIAANREASEASPRDVVKALELTSHIRTDIGANPEQAIRSAGEIEEAQAAKLLK